MENIGLVLVPTIALVLMSCGDHKMSHDHEMHSAASDESASSTEDNMSLTDEPKVGDAIGTIKTMSPTNDAVIIKHGPFKGDISMGAMTMGFGATGTVDLSQFDEGDRVAFRVKLGRDGEYRIMDICQLPDGEDNCLDQSAH